MSKLYGFKYTVSEWAADADEYKQYCILSESDNRYYIDKFYKGTARYFDITDKIDEFCEALKSLNIDKWNMHNYQSLFEWFPHPARWTLELYTDSISVACRGQGDRTPEWKSFVDLLNQMGDIISE